MVTMSDINYLGTTPLGKIANFKSSKTSGITAISFPAEDGDKAEGIDTLGMVSYFTIAGYFVGQFSDIQTYIDNIRNIADGYQTVVSYIKSPYVNTYVDDAQRRGNINVTSGLTTNYLVDGDANFISWNIKAGDIVKNLNTGTTANVVAPYIETSIQLDADIFSAINEPYAITATMACKVLSFDTEWQLPGLNYCRYTLAIMQNRDT